MLVVGQVQVELIESGVFSVVWVIIFNGCYSIVVYVVFKIGGFWCEVVGEFVDLLCKDLVKVLIKDGLWGCEVIGIVVGVVCFIGVNGYCWMI